MIGALTVWAMPLLVGVVSALSIAIGDIAARRGQVDVRWQLPALAATALVGARGVYVWQFHLAYFGSPGSILDIRDGGWSPEGGFVCLWLAALWMVRRHPALKRPIRTAVLSATLLWTFGAAALASRGVKAQGEGLPAVQLTTRAGSPFDLRTLRGRPTVVNLWATWCPPCNEEMPVLAQAQASRPDVRFVFIDQGESTAQVDEWLREHQLDLHDVLVDPRQRAGAALGQRAFPTSYFFDANGQLVDMRVGALSPAVLADKLGKIAPTGG